MFYCAVGEKKVDTVILPRRNARGGYFAIMGAAQCKEACDTFAKGIEAKKEASPSGQCNSVPWYLDVKVDEEGCRVFPPLPPKGSHPRLMFTENEIPALLARHTHTFLKGVLQGNAEQNLGMFRAYHQRVNNLSPEERANPSRKTLDEFFRKDEARNNYFLTSYIHGFATNDTDLQNMVKEMVLWYATVLTKACEMARSQNIQEHPYNYWHNTFSDMQTSWLFGGGPYALLYDFLFNSMNPEEQSLVRKSISLCISGRRAWGMGAPARTIQSNWAPYHGDLLVLALAIEGEEGEDREVVTLFQDLMVHYMDYAVYDSGHPIEDAYAPNLALREGSGAFLVMARRGFNLFRHPHYVRIFKKWMPYALEPHKSGGVYGGSSGSALVYPTAFFVAKFMFPKDPVIDFVYRKYLNDGTEYGRIKAWQTRWHASMFALPCLNETLCPATPEDDPHAPLELSLPLTFSCINRGKAIMRSDWTQNAMWFTLDARPDSFLIGHDTASRGAFVLNANGRRWADCPEWRYFKESSDYSLVAIDGAGQVPKAPYVKPLPCIEGPSDSTYAGADLTYAYNYEWTQWKKEHENLRPAGWEPEPHDPRDFNMTEWWLPNKIFDEPDIAFVGLWQWRRRISTVAKVTRTTLMVRSAPSPFVIICDDAVKDEEEHEYTWRMTMPIDVVLISFDGRDAILGEKGDAGRRLLVRLLDVNGGASVECSHAEFSKEHDKQKNADGSWKLIYYTRLQFKLCAKEAHFKIGLFPLESESSEIPTTDFDGSSASIQVGASLTTVAFEVASGSSQETKMSVLSN